jgi:hypothetical protein
MPGDYDESKHPRATDGKFSSVPGAPGTSTTTTPPPPTTTPREPRATRAASGVRAKVKAGAVAKAKAKAKIPKGVKFDPKPHDRAISKLRTQEAKFRTQSIAIKAKMGALKKEARAKAKTPAQKARYKARFDKLAAKRDELKAKADTAKTGRADARKAMAAAREKHASDRKAVRDAAKAARAKKKEMKEFRSLLDKKPTLAPSAAAPAAAPAAPNTTAVGDPEPIIWERKKNPNRVAAAKIAAEASAERRREILSAVASNLPQELQAAWSKESHKFMQQEAPRIRGVKDRISAASKISEAFAEQYASGSESAHGNEGDRWHRRAEIEAKQAESWADEQESRYYEAAMRAEQDRRPTPKVPDDDADCPF